MGPEAKLYQKLKRNTPSIIFTVELKVAKGNKIRFSPHQIAFHIQHPKNTFILIEALGQRCFKLFPGSEIRGLSSEGHGYGWPLATSWEEIQKIFNELN